MDLVREEIWKPTTMKPCFKIAEIANAWNVSTQTIHRMLKRGELKAFKVGRGVRITADEVKRWAKEQAAPIVAKVQAVTQLLKSDGQSLDVRAARIAELEKRLKEHAMGLAQLDVSTKETLQTELIDLREKAELESFAAQEVRR